MPRYGHKVQKGEETDLRELRDRGDELEIECERLRTLWADPDLDLASVTSAGSLPVDSLTLAFMRSLPADLELKDTDGRYLILNRGAEERYGVSNGAAYRKRAHDIFDRETADAIEAHDRAVLERGLAQTRPIAVPGCRAGDYLVTKFPLYSSEGKIIGIAGLGARSGDLQANGSLFRETRGLHERAEAIAQIGHWEWDEVEDRCIHCSPQLAKIIGVSVESYMAAACSTESELQFVLEADRAHYTQGVNGAQDRGAVGFDIEYRILRSNGEVSNVREVGEFIRDESGRVVRSIGFVQDITEQRANERAQREVELRFRSMVENLRGIIFCRGVLGEGRHGYDDGGLAVYGSDAQHIAGNICDGRADLDLWHRCVHPDDRPAYWLLERQRKEEGQDYTIEYRFRHPQTGEDKWVRERAWTVPDAEQSVTYLDSFIIDITEQKAAENALRDAHDELEQRVRSRTAEIETVVSALKAEVSEHQRTEDALRHSEAQIRLITDNLPVLIIEIDRDLRYRFVNKTFESWHARPASDVVGRHMYDVLGPGMFRQLEPTLRGAFEGQTTSGEFTVSYEDGQTRHVVANYVPFAGKNGDVSVVFGLVVDLTERVRAEQEADRNRTLLADAIEAAVDGFAIFDSDERLVMCNSRYREAYGAIGDLVVPGLQMLELVKAAAQHCVDLDPEISVDDQVRDRIARFRDSAGGLEERLHDGRWFRVNAHRLPNGWTVCTRSDITVLKAREEALREQQAHLRQAQAMARVGFFIWDEAERRCLYCSDELANLLGMSVEEVLESDSSYEDMLMSIHPEDRERFHETSETALKAGRPYVVEYRIQDKSGQYWHWRELGEPVFDEGGELTLTFGTVQDITEMKEREEALRESQSQLRQAHSMAGIGVFIWDDVQGRCAYCSEELAQLLDMSVEDFMRDRSTHADILRHVHPDDRARYDATVADAERAKRPYSVEYRVQDGAGGTRYWQEMGEPLLNGQGELVRTFGTVQDITSIRQAEAALRESERRYREVVERVPAGILVVSGGSIVFTNSQALVTFGASSPSQLLGRPASSLLSANFQALLQDAEGLQLGEAGAAPLTESLCFRIDGKTFTAEVSASKIDWQGGDGIQIFVRDVGSRKALEQQLYQAQKMRAVGDLTGGIAHDFNNLLFVIRASLDLIEQDLGKDSSVSEMLQAVSAAAQAGSDLTGRLLAFSRQQPLQPQVVDVADLVRDWVRFIQRTLGVEIQIRTSFESDVHTVLIDPGQLQNAILNLAVNARDAMPQGGVLSISVQNARLDRRQVKGQPDLAPGDYVRIVVADSGGGMSEEAVKRAFDPFFTTKEAGSGTGLGLSMVYGFIKQSGGHIEIDSKLGRGTRVTIHLPQADGPDREPAVANKIDPSDKAGKFTVLVAEDDEAVRSVTLSILDRLGYRTLAAEDGEEALRMLEQLPDIDLLFSDIVMPGEMHGWRLAREAKNRYPKLKVVMASAYVQPRSWSVDAETVDVPLIRKPYKAQELAEMLESVLAEREA